MLFWALLFSPVAYLIEKNNKKNKNPTPLFPITNEIILFYVTWLAYKSPIDEYYKFIFIIGSLLHFFRILLYYEEYYNISLFYQILGAISTISLFTDYYFIYPLFNLFINYKLNNNFAFNMLIDPVAIYALTHILISNQLTKGSIINNYVSAVLIYHILEIFFSIYHENNAPKE